jgi:hypothetical protein
MLNDLAERTAIPGWSPQKPKVCIAIKLRPDSLKVIKDTFDVARAKISGWLGSGD